MTTVFPADVQLWISSLDPSYRRATEHMLQIVGKDAFAKHWRLYRDQVLKLEHDFG
jgi:hypothetical protein